MELEPRKEFKREIPNQLLQEESTEERRRIQRLWMQFTASVNDLCKTRRNILVNKNIRKSVFDSGMENLCKGFSRRHMHVKVEWKNKHDKAYKLVLVRLSVVPQAILHCQWFSAEIPQPEVQAELVGEEEPVTFDATRSDHPLLTAQIVSSTPMEPVQVVPIESDVDPPPFAFQVLRIENSSGGG